MTHHTRMIAMSVISAVVLVTAGCNDTASTPTKAPEAKITGNTCRDAEQVPGYAIVQEDGSTVEVPAGVMLVIEAREEGQPLKSACSAIVSQWEQDQGSPGYRVIG